MCVPPRTSAPTWPSRSTSMAEFTDTSDRSRDRTTGSWA
jgi:hypothetical protein